MIELQDEKLVFSFPELDDELTRQIHAWIEKRFTEATIEDKIHLPDSREELYAKFNWCIPKVRACVSFQKTLRIPDDGKDYPLPPGLGNFPIRHVDDFPRAPKQWGKRGGVIVPMYKTEAMWLNFSASYPMALKVGAGHLCAVSGEPWSSGLRDAPQNYVVLPEQPWLDGFRVSRDAVRQFIAVPLGKGLTVEHQLSGREEWGGLQLQVFPQKVEREPTGFIEQVLRRLWSSAVRPSDPTRRSGYRGICSVERSSIAGTSHVSSISGMGLGAGGKMMQSIESDSYGLDAWDTSVTSRCFVHLCAADDWRQLTDIPPPHRPPTAQDYTNAGLPWYEYESGNPAATCSTALADVKSVNALVGEKTGLDLQQNETIDVKNALKINPRTNGVVTEF